ncbi:transposase [Saccharothrix sp. ALI-22-I]|uniref:transposase n=1 Tax=Saccharothrix sp. ALI-22-I TaxID=1933778 RepID=UPI001EE740EA|nr:transposase [Saccharothrix sp. ALI-22-I]
MNAHRERLIGTVRRELLDHILITGEAHARQILKTYENHYNRHRPHQARDQLPPQARRHPAPVHDLGAPDCCAPASSADSSTSTNTPLTCNDDLSNGTRSRCSPCRNFSGHCSTELRSEGRAVEAWALNSAPSPQTRPRGVAVAGRRTWARRPTRRGADRGSLGKRVLHRLLETQPGTTPEGVVERPVPDRVSNRVLTLAVWAVEVVPRPESGHAEPGPGVVGGAEQYGRTFTAVAGGDGDPCQQFEVRRDAERVVERLVDAQALAGVGKRVGRLAGREGGAGEHVLDPGHGPLLAAVVGQRPGFLAHVDSLGDLPLVHQRSGLENHGQHGDAGGLVRSGSAQSRQRLILQIDGPAVVVAEHGRQAEAGGRPRRRRIVPEPVGQDAGQLVENRPHGHVALQDGDVAGSPQGVDALAAGVGFDLEQLLQPVAPLGQQTAGDPVEPQRGRQPQSGPCLARGGPAELQCRAQVGVVASHEFASPHLVRPEPAGLGRLGQPQVVVPVPDPQGRLVTAGAKPVQPVLADRLQQAQPRVAVELLREHHGLVGQAGQHVEHVGVFDAVPAADVFGGGEVEAAGEDRQPAPQRSFGGRAQAETPVQRGSQQLLPVVAGKQPEAVVQPVQHLPGRQAA